LIKHLKVAMPISRRAFLKSFGFAAGVAVMVDRNEEALPTESSIQAYSASFPSDSPVSLVDLFQGNDSTPVYSLGNTLPLAARPFGMTHWTLLSHANTPWMFQPGERRIQGFRSTHQLSPWLGDHGYATFLPFCGSIQPELTSRTSSYRRKRPRKTLRIESAASGASTGSVVFNGQPVAASTLSHATLMAVRHL
jgi:putative alpha-1,2-mannosidase